LLAGCDLREPTAPRAHGADHPPTSPDRLVAAVALEVDPSTGQVGLADPGTAAPPLAAAVSVTGAHVRAQARCAGCADARLDNQTITVRFTVADVVLDQVRFAG